MVKKSLKSKTDILIVIVDIIVNAITELQSRMELNKQKCMKMISWYIAVKKLLLID